MKEIVVTFRLNGKETTVSVPPALTLLKLLRERLGLTGAKPGCERGECGACTVHLDGAPVNSCLVLAAQVDGREVVTVEGLERGGELHPLQEAFIEESAIQCGYCTPGMVMAAKGLLDRTLDPSPEEIRRAVSGNICRCTGYTKIFAAVRSAAEKMRGGA
ncbi:MAG TPA: (2Fe-2S)-binding protein [bacterium]|nr:(2Fe-2S)-binding protein [bacterium]HPQ67053.1 (2Fe-2S)-binding protein [bacterium]